MSNWRLFRLALILGIIALLRTTGSLPGRGTPGASGPSSALGEATAGSSAESAVPVLALPDEPAIVVEDLVARTELDPIGGGGDVWVTETFAGLPPAEQRSVLAALAKAEPGRPVESSRPVKSSGPIESSGPVETGPAETGTVVVWRDAEELGRFTPADGTWRAAAVSESNATGGGK